MAVCEDMWREVTVPISPQTGTIDLWRVDLDRSPATIDSLFELLADDEKERANRFVFSKDRSHYVVGRATLRKIIGRYLCISPGEIVFSVRHYGKPYLSGGGTDLRFNLSHSKSIAVIAVTLNREVGVDVEFVDPEFDVFSIAPSVFSPVEVAHLRSLSQNVQTATFFAGWTRKEALLKAIGDGLSSADELQSAVSLINEDRDSCRLFANNRTTDWSLTSFEIDDDFKAALVVEGKIGPVRYLRLADDRE